MDYDRNIHHNPDAMAWAKFFVVSTKDMGREVFCDEGYMVGWFANAMMAMHDSMKPHEAADEIERLRWENANMEKLWGKSEKTWMEIRDKQDAEIERLQRENERLQKVNDNYVEAVEKLKVIIDKQSDEIERLLEALQVTR